MRRSALVAAAAAVAATLAACGGGEAELASSPQTAPSATETGTTTAGDQDAKVDPREDGFEIALGEWAITPEAESIRPGRVVFVISNRGSMPHGFEIEREDGSDDDGKVETRTLGPGESVELQVNLAEGVYKLECTVDGHDERGMELLFEVRRDAPLAAPAGADAKGVTAVAIEGFAF